MTGMQLFDFVCLLTGFVLFLLAGFNVAHPRVNFVGLGLAAWILVPLVHLIDTL
jgi:hypothetical protein